MKRFIVLLSAVILCLTLAGCSGSQYKKATELYEQGNYAEAGEIFSKLGDYGDSADKVKFCVMAVRHLLKVTESWLQTAQASHLVLCLQMMIMMRQKQFLVLLAVTKTAQTK